MTPDQIAPRLTEHGTSADKAHNEINLKEAVFDNLRGSITRANIKYNTIKQYCKAYKELRENVKTLANHDSGKADEIIE